MSRTKHDSTGDQKGTDAVDIPRLKAKYGDQNIPHVIDLFLNEAPAQIDKIEQSIEGQDASAVMDSAHGLKGMCTAICANSLWQLVVNLESAGAQTNWPSIKQIIKETRLEYKNVERVLSSLNNEISSVKDQ